AGQSFNLKDLPRRTCVDILVEGNPTLGPSDERILVEGDYENNASSRTVCISPTTPKSTSSKIGASSSLLTATMVFEVCMPARCWIAPEMPLAMYSCGETDLPVWPTWLVCGYQPASTAAREAPTAAPRESARASTTEKFSALPTPRPPE